MHVSKQENQVADYIQSLLDEHGIECSMKRSITFNEISNGGIDSNKELDIYLPELMFAIEYNGMHWHSDEMMLKSKGMTSDEYNDIKIGYCDRLGIELLIIDEKDWIDDNADMKAVISGIILTQSICKN